MNCNIKEPGFRDKNKNRSKTKDINVTFGGFQ